MMNMVNLFLVNVDHIIFWNKFIIWMMNDDDEGLVSGTRVHPRGRLHPRLLHRLWSPSSSGTDERVMSSVLLASYWCLRLSSQWGPLIGHEALLLITEALWLAPSSTSHPTSSWITTWSLSTYTTDSPASASSVSTPSSLAPMLASWTRSQYVWLFGSERSLSSANISYLAFSGSCNFLRF